MRLIASFFLIIASLWSVAHAQPVRTGNAVAELVSERAAIAPGDQFLVALKLDIDEGWHVYWKNPGDSGLPAEINWVVPEGVSFSDFTWPVPHEQPLDGLMNYGYETQLVLPLTVNAPSGYQAGDTLNLEGAASWLICKDICIPEDARLSLSLPVAAAPVEDPANGAFIASALEASPMALTGEAVAEDLGDAYRVSLTGPMFADALNDAVKVRIFPDTHAIEHPAEQSVRVGADGAQIDLTKSNLAPAELTNFSGVVAIEAADGARRGFRFDATPGVAPTGVSDRALSLSGAGATSTRGGETLGFAGLLTYLALAFIGGMILNLMPCVLPVLSIKASGLIHAAHKEQGGQSALRRHGVAYLAGVVLSFLIMGAALLALRSVGEQAGLGFQLQYPPAVAFLALLVFLIGLNLLGVFEIGTSIQGAGGELTQKSGSAGAFFTGVLAAVVGAPCVGPFLGATSAVVVSQPAPIVLLVFGAIGLGLAAPFAALSFSPTLARYLPKPGQWMETLKEFFAFPMFLTAAFLVWVFAGQAGADGAALLIAAAAAISFGVWVIQRAGGATVARFVGLGVILAAFVVPVISVSGRAPAEAAELASLDVEVDEGVWSPERVAQLREEGRPIFVDFTARWCVTCQVNKRVAIKTPQVSAAFTENDVAFLTADWTNRDTIIASALAEHGRAGVPLYLMYPEGGGDPAILPQLLTPAMVVDAVEKAAG